MMSSKCLKRCVAAAAVATAALLASASMAAPGGAEVEHDVLLVPFDLVLPTPCGVTFTISGHTHLVRHTTRVGDMLHVITSAGPSSDIVVVDDDGNEYVGTGRTIRVSHHPADEEYEQQFVNIVKILGPGDLPNVLIQQVGVLLFDADNNFIGVRDVRVDTVRCLP